MLEFYTKQIEDIDSQTVQLIANINTTQSVIKITLDSQRNTLLLLELRLVMLSVSISTGFSLLFLSIHSFLVSLSKFFF